MSLKLALRLVTKSTNNVFHTASVLNKISEIHVYSFKVLDAMLRTAFSSTFLGLKLALKVLLKSTHNILS